MGYWTYIKQKHLPTTSTCKLRSFRKMLFDIKSSSLSTSMLFPMRGSLAEIKTNKESEGNEIENYIN